MCPGCCCRFVLTRHLLTSRVSAAGAQEMNIVAKANIRDRSNTIEFNVLSRFSESSGTCLLESIFTSSLKLT